MIAYFDTSAIIPLLVHEPGTAVARELWNRAPRVASVRLVYPEARAALAHARRARRLLTRQLRTAVTRLDDLVGQLDIVELDEDLARDAGAAAEALGLRGYDAVHLAAATRLAELDVVVAAGDRALLDAARRVGLHTAAVG